MRTRIYLFLIVVLLLAACQPKSAATVTPTAQPAALELQAGDVMF